MLRHILVSLALVALVGGVYVLATTPGRQLVDRVHINMERAEHLARFGAGQPLRGTPDLARLEERLKAKGGALGDPIHIRIYKLESELELWIEKDGRFELFATYPICLWSGRLGPKLKEGDLQAPEGFYTVSEEQLNPNSRWHRSFNLGFPNVYDRSKDRTGSFLMVHGGCASVGCYAMTNDVVTEIWAFVTKALDNGQDRIPVHAFPFRMTERNLKLRSGDEWSGFWADLKTGHDLFEQSGVPPVVSVCEGRYVFEEGAASTYTSLVEERCPSEVADNL